ncbi:RNA polymerase II Rpb3/Rpb11 [Cryptosporidium tyzzeri]|nr:RNA polymerase II Rpb3/Rpb11 [Cryptosporidium tyzzeri]
MGKFFTVNKPDVNLLDIPAGSEKVQWKVESRVPCCGSFMIMLEDHTLGNLITTQLLRDPNVIFAGYKVPHPLEPLVQIRIQTRENTTPFVAIQNAIKSIQIESQVILNSFKDSMRNYPIYK